MFSVKGKGIVPVVFIALFISLLGGCSGGKATEKRAYTVSWYSGFKMPELLAEDVNVERRGELSGLLSKEWYAPVDIINTRGEEEGTVSSCEEYFQEVTPETRTLREHEMNAFVELAIMCRATKLLSSADNPRTSYIPESILNASSPDQLPPELALETSETESDKNRNDPTVQYWGDINKIRKLDAISPHVVDFYTTGGVQRLEPVGRGDFDGDGVEDVLISSRDSVDGGSYQHLRLFVLSVDAEGDWQIIKSYQ
ncbi:hypothetical protein [Marinimicrobium locisalis]|uniref:hypothetical protein n=1 Tax=Marinimicrobium locisalis TaxID=546022 RepID=UPI0032221EFA